jgi:hypothetical protein
MVFLSSVSLLFLKSRNRAAFFFLVNFVVNGLDEYGKNVLDLVHFFGFPA